MAITINLNTSMENKDKKKKILRSGKQAFSQIDPHLLPSQLEAITKFIFIYAF